ncbi:hypothetical protein IJJ08_04495 [bacterium]|nr:hypothetical protein [bacterium]
MKNKLLLTSFLLLLALWSCWSWILVNPNLLFTSWAPYVSWQTWWQETFYQQRPLVTAMYLSLLILLFVNYCLLAKNLPAVNQRSCLWLSILVTLPLFFAYNALSSDVFNYLFNAKMVIHYHDNPHVHTALDYQQDDWVRFMHNIHTPAPYGYGYTLVSLLPFVLGLGKLLPTWLSFRLFNVGLWLASIASLLYFYQHLRQDLPSARFWWLIFNPLLLLELIGNIHNDLWMILPALWSLYWIYPQPSSKKSRWQIVTSALCLVFSASIKYATLALLPLWLWAWWQNYPQTLNKLSRRLTLEWQKFWAQTLAWINFYFFDLCTLAMFLPLLTDRAQRFHPWYLSWSLMFLPLTRSRITLVSLVILSLSAMSRYAPYLWFNEFTPGVLLSQQLMTLLPVAFYWLVVVGQWAITHRHDNCVRKHTQKVV